MSSYLLFLIPDVILVILRFTKYVVYQDYCIVLSVHNLRHFRRNLGPQFLSFTIIKITCAIYQRNTVHLD